MVDLTILRDLLEGTDLIMVENLLVVKIQVERGLLLCCAQYEFFRDYKRIGEAISIIGA